MEPIDHIIALAREMSESSVLQTQNQQELERILEEEVVESQRVLLENSAQLLSLVQQLKSEHALVCATCTEVQKLFHDESLNLFDLIKKIRRAIMVATALFWVAGVVLTLYGVVTLILKLKGI